MYKVTLEAARVNVHLTQDQAAEKLGVNKKTVWNWENGLSLPNPIMIDNICELYGVSYDMLNFLPQRPLKADKA